ncbi:MAG: deoxyribose-phosphate aldolase [Bacteroidota bacterium]
MQIASFIDHTLLKADTKLQEIHTLCKEANTHHFYAVCIPPYYVEQASKLLEKTPVKIATVIGFPMGYAAVPAKVEEIKRAIQKGADEIDAVINIAAVKSADWKHVKNEINSIYTAVNIKRKVLKLIIETALLTEEEMGQVCAICNDIGIDFVKNATGFNGGSANVKTIEFLRTALVDDIKIKASAGIRTAAFTRQLIEAGADRIGTSSGLAIVGEMIEIEH